MLNFEKLDTWQHAMKVADTVYSVTRAFPDAERFGLTSQMRRAAVSIASNIAEGNSRTSHPEQARYLEIAGGSVYELVTQANIALRQGFLTQSEYALLYECSEKQCRMLSGLRRSLLTRH